MDFLLRFIPYGQKTLNMKDIKVPVLLTTALLFLFALLPAFGVGLLVMFPFFIIVHLFTLWRVFRILMDGHPSEKKFDEGHWYDDLDFKVDVE